MAAKFAEIFIKLGLKKEGFDKEVKKTSTGFSDMAKSLAKTGAVMGGVAVGAVLAGKKIWEMGKSGAAAIQTGESFEFLLEKVGAAPDLLDQLRDATLGTVDDMTLMESTLTLTAGAGDDLSKMMMEAAPQLAKIAKAANKLNPALGDTAFMYQSIGTGVKRAQPLILDNLGLTLKVGAANEAFAKSIGKTVEQLTAEEKAMAILNATLEAGDQLIDQVGGSVDAVGDKMAKAEASMKNLTGQWSTFVAIQTEKAAPALTDMLEGINENLISQDMYNKAMDQGIIEMGDYTEAVKENNNTNFTAAEMIEWITEETEKYNEKIEGVTSGLEYSKEAQRDFNWAMLDGIEATDDLAEAQRNLKQDLSDLKLFVSGPLGKAYEDYEQKQNDVQAEILETKARIKELKDLGPEMTEEHQQEVLDLQARLGELSIEFNDNADAHDEATKRIMFNLLSQRVSMVLTSDASQEFKDKLIDHLNKVALQWGIVDQATYDYVTNADRYYDILESDTIETMGIVKWEIEELIGVIGETSLATQTIIDGFGNLRSTLEGLSGTYDIKIRQFYEVFGQPATGPQDFGGVPIPGPPVPGPTPEKEYEEELPPWRGQHGLSMIVPSGYPNDTFPFLASSGEHVQITPRGRRGSGNTYISNRGGDSIYVQNSAAAAFLVEKQHQAEFDEIDKVI